MVTQRLKKKQELRQKSDN